MSAAEQVQEHGSLVGRVGLLARAVVYGLMGLLALRIAVGERGAKADGQGALRLLADQPLGTALLVALAVGFGGYALWRFVRAAIGAGEGRTRDGASGALKRIGDVLNGLVYLSLLAATLRVVTSGRTGRSGDEQARSWSARLLEQGWGRAAVIATGIACVIGAGAMVWYGAARHFEAHLRTTDMSTGQRTWLPRLGVVGHCARGLVLALVGVFLVRAGVGYDANEAVGIDGALHRLARQPHGTVALVAVALGFLAYAAYSVVEARWRRVLEG